MKTILMVLFAMGLSFFNFQPQGTEGQNTLQVGDVLVIGTPKTHSYKHIHFPRLNFVVKRGGLPNYKSVMGNVVVVQEVKEMPNGKTKVVLSRKNGAKFLRFLKTVEADYNAAVAAGELVQVK